MCWVLIHANEAVVFLSILQPIIFIFFFISFSFVYFILSVSHLANKYIHMRFSFGRYLGRQENKAKPTNQQQHQQKQQQQQQKYDESNVRNGNQKFTKASEKVSTQIER